MACGMIAMLNAGIEVDRYVAFEIDKYAVKTSSYNFPDIEHKGDVFDADFTEYQDFDFLVGGSPCTYWSIAQKNGRETEASGMGWELFQQYVRALREAKPKFFIYENNKSMSKAIRASIDEAFGFEAVLINSALVSAQNRQRLYWVGKRNADGTYSKVKVEQPIDRGILLKDVLDGNTDREKARAVIGSIGRTTTREYFDKQQGTMAYEPVGYNLTFDEKSWVTIKKCAKYLKSVWGEACEESVRIPEYGTVDKARPINAHYPNNCGGFEHRMFSDNPNKQQVDMIAEPIYVGEIPEHNGQYRNGKQPSQQYRVYSVEGKSVAVDRDSRKNIAEPVRVGALPRPNGELSTSQAMRIYSTDGKSVNINSGGGGMGGKTGLYAIPVEFDGDIPTKAISQADGKTYRVHKVENGLITIKGKQYPIKLADGYYIIRKLTVRECMRLQTVPEWYEFPVSDSRAYRLLGNGWTCEVIIHLIKSCLAGKVDDETEFKEQIKFF